MERKKYVVIWTWELILSLALDVEIMQPAMCEMDKLGLKGYDVGENFKKSLSWIFSVVCFR